MGFSFFIYTPLAWLFFPFQAQFFLMFAFSAPVSPPKYRIQARFQTGSFCLSCFSPEKKTPWNNHKSEFDPHFMISAQKTRKPYVHQV